MMYKQGQVLSHDLYIHDLTWSVNNDWKCFHACAVFCSSGNDYNKNKQISLHGNFNTELFHSRFRKKLPQCYTTECDIFPLRNGPIQHSSLFVILVGPFVTSLYKRSTMTDAGTLKKKNLAGVVMCFSNCFQCIIARVIYILADRVADVA